MAGVLEIWAGVDKPAIPIPLMTQVLIRKDY
jgi:hypothetical protein